MQPEIAQNTNIDTFLFDIGNVLVTFDFSKAIRFLNKHSALGETEITQATQRLLIPLETGAISGEAFLSELAASTQFDGDTSSLRTAFQDIFELNSAMPSVVEALKGRYRLVLFSNTSKLHKEWLFEKYPVFAHFNAAIYSYVSGSMKPDDEMYLDAIEKLSITPQNTIYFDDAPANVATGIRHGFRAIEYLPDRHHQVIEEIKAMGIEIR